MNDHQSSSFSYLIPPAAILRVMQAIPPKRRRKPAMIRREISVALGKLARDQEVKPDGVTGAWLADRIAAYYRSPEGNGGFAMRDPSAWLEGHGWEEDESVWSARDEKAQLAEREKKISDDMARRRQERLDQQKQWRLEAE